MTIFEFTEFRVYYLLPDFYCLRLNPVEATEVGGWGRGGKRNQGPCPRGAMFPCSNLLELLVCLPIV